MFSSGLKIMDGICFSVVIPLYNKEYIVDSCLESLANQTRLPEEVVIVNDGSTDGSYKIANEFKCQHPEIKVIVIDQENAGVSVARNKGVSLSSYEFVCFLDADDEWKPDFLQTMEDLIVDFPDAVLYCLGHEVSDGRGSVKVPKHGCPENFRGYVKDFFAASSKGSVAKSSKVCVKKSVLASFGGFPEGVVAGEDLYVWSMLALKGTVVCEDVVAARVNQAVDSSRGARKTITVPYPIVFYGNNRNFLREHHSLPSYLSKVLLRHMVASMMHGNYKEAFSRWWAFRKISIPRFIIYSAAFLIPPFILRARFG